METNTLLKLSEKKADVRIIVSKKRYGSMYLDNSSKQI